MHGLCTLGATAVELGRLTGAHPADLKKLEGRFAAAIHPGESANLRAWGHTADLTFDLVKDGTPTISGGRVAFTR